MPDTPIETPQSGRYPPDMESRVTVLQHLARATFETLERMERASERRFESMDRRFDAIDGRFDAIDGRFAAIDGRFAAIDGRFAAFDARFEGVERRLEAISTEYHADFRWLLGVMLASWASVMGVLGGILAVMAHGFHWF